MKAENRIFKEKILREIFYKKILKELKDAKTIIDVGAGNSLYKYRYAKKKLKFYEFVRDKLFRLGVKPSTLKKLYFLFGSLFGRFIVVELRKEVE